MSRRNLEPVKNEKFINHLKNMETNGRITAKKMKTIADLLGHNVSPGEISKIFDPNKVKSISPEMCRKLAEIVGITRFDLDNLLEDITNTDSWNFVVGVTGPSCSGKSYFTEAIKRILTNDVCLFGFDDFYHPADVVEPLRYRYDDPKSIKQEEAYAALRKLKIGTEKVEVPDYDRSISKSVKSKYLTPKKIILAEGIFACSTPMFRSCYDLVVWVDSTPAKRAMRRLTRDTSYSREFEVISKAYVNEVEPAYEEHLLPLRTRFSNIQVNNEDEFDADPRNEDKWPIGLRMVINFLKGRISLT